MVRDDQKCGAHDMLVEMIRGVATKLDRLKTWVIIAAAAGGMTGGALPSCAAWPFKFVSAEACLEVARESDQVDPEPDTEEYIEFELSSDEIRDYDGGAE